MRCDLLRDAGASLMANLDLRAHDLLDRSITLAREAEDAARFTDAVLLRCYRGPGVRAEVFETDHEVLELIEEAHGSLGDDAGRRALLLSAKVGELMWDSDPAERRELSDTALALARETGASASWRTPPCSMNGPTPGSAPQTPAAHAPLTLGDTATTITDTTPPSAARPVEHHGVNETGSAPYPIRASGQPGTNSCASTP